MTTHRPISNRVYLASTFALAAAAMIGIGYSHALSPAGNAVAECFDGQTIDSATGVCPQELPGPSTGDASDPGGSSSEVWAPAVQEAESATNADESLAGSH